MAKKTERPPVTKPASGGLFPIWVGGFFAMVLAGGLFLFLGRPSANAAANAQPPVQAQSQPEAPQAQAPAAAASQADADMAPDFSLADVNTGKTFKLSAQRGKVVLVDFWATWCGPCRMAIPHLIELQDLYKGKGLQVVGVSLDQQGPAVVKPFYQQWKMNYIVGVDDQGNVARQYGGIRSIPTAVLIGKNGKVITGFVGYRPKEEYENAIKKALAAKG